MQFSLKSCYKYAGRITLLSVLCLIFGALSALAFQAGVILLPVVAALYASVLTLERAERRIASYLIPPVLLIVELLISGLYSYNCIMSVLAGFFIFVALRRGFGKCECAFTLTALLTLYMLLLSLLLAFFNIGEVSLEGAIAYYSEVFSALRTELVNVLTEITVPTETGTAATIFTEETVNLIFDQTIALLLPVTIVFAFLLVGLTHKLYGAIINCNAEDGRRVYGWSFLLPPVFAYFYVAVFIANFFTEGGDSIYALTVTALNFVLLYVFSYLGFRFAVGLLARRISTALARLVVIVCILFFSAGAVQILSLFGVVYTLMADRLLRMGGGTGSTDK
ncbi:MAG: hypothetical protein IKA64_03900 [Clostridia bacterium]|nr:hypothetical protein [Clostridia bacterium]